MRFVAPAFVLAALAALTGCSNPVPATPDGAWEVNLTSNGGACDLMISTRSEGVVSATDIEQRMTDGVMGTSVSCNVVPSGANGAGPFSVTASLLNGADSLEILVPSIAAGATKAAPAAGSVSYESDATVSLYSSPSCDFYFADPKEGVSAMGTGMIWVAFTCAGLTSGGTGSTCPVSESYALFENCLTVSE